MIYAYRDAFWYGLETRHLIFRTLLFSDDPLWRVCLSCPRTSEAMLGRVGAAADLTAPKLGLAS
jgi:hypothetical protein